MTAEYTDRTRSRRTYTAAITEPEVAGERAVVLAAMIREGAAFPGNAAGWQLTAHTWEPNPPGQQVSIGGRRVVGEIQVTSRGLALAHREDPAEYITSVPVFAA